VTGILSVCSLDGFVVLCVQGPPDTRSSRCHCHKNVIFNNRIVVVPVGCFEMGREGESRVFNRVTTDIRDCVCLSVCYQMEKI